MVLVVGQVLVADAFAVSYLQTFATAVLSGVGLTFLLFIVVILQISILIPLNEIQDHFELCLQKIP